MGAGKRAKEKRLWLVGNSRYGTIATIAIFAFIRLWLVGNSRYGTIQGNIVGVANRYGL